jgi:hypothetical protein
MVLLLKKKGKGCHDFQMMVKKKFIVLHWPTILIGPDGDFQ